MRMWRSRLVQLVAVAALLAGVPLVVAAPASALPTVTSCDQSPLVWTGATGDELWDTAANWTDRNGGHRVPDLATDTCIDTRVGGPVRAPSGIRTGELTLAGTASDPAVNLSGSVSVGGSIGGTGNLVLSGQVYLVAGFAHWGRLEVTAGSVVTFSARFTAWDDYVTPDSIMPMEIAGTIHLVYGGLAGDIHVLSGGVVDNGTATGTSLGFRGNLDIEDGGLMRFSHSAVVDFWNESRLSGGQPELVDVAVQTGGAFPLTVRGAVTIGGIGSKATLLVRPENGRLSVGHFADQYVHNSGTLDIEGPLADLGPNELPIAPVDGHLVNDGTLNLAGVQVRGPVENQGTMRVSRFTTIQGAGSGLVNRGSLEVGPRLGAGGMLDSSLLVTQELQNEGTIVSTSPTSEITAGSLSGSGPIGGRINLIGGNQAPARPGLLRPLLVDELGWGAARLHLDIQGVAGSDADRVQVAGALVDLGAAHGFDLSFTRGYQPCGGARWQLLTRPKVLLGYRAPGSTITGNVPGAVPGPTDLHVTGLPAGVTVALEERSDGYVAVASGMPADPFSCGRPAYRLASGLYIEGLGRPATASELVDFWQLGPDGRKAGARRLLAGDVATRRFVDDEMRRILGRPVAAANVAAYATRIRQGVTIDQVRAEVYGDAGFFANSGHTTDGWARTLYRTELGRAISSQELIAVRNHIHSGLSRATVARYLLAGNEADRALAARSIELWWARPATSAEQATWAALYGSSLERSVTASLAAAAPIP